MIFVVLKVADNRISETRLHLFGFVYKVRRIKVHRKTRRQWRCNGCLFKMETEIQKQDKPTLLSANQIKAWNKKILNNFPACFSFHMGLINFRRNFSSNNWSGCTSWSLLGGNNHMNAITSNALSKVGVVFWSFVTENIRLLTLANTLLVRRLLNVSNVVFSLLAWT